jgi:MFS family permease
MLSSITPLGERSRGNRWWLTVSAYVLGSVLGGALVGGALGALGLPLRWAGVSPVATAVVAGLLALAALAFDVGGGRLPLPRYKRQVNEDWMTLYRGWVYGVGWGVQLGMGLTTIVTSAVVYLVFFLAFLTGSPLLGMLIGATFGTVRGLVVLVVARVQTPDELLGLHRSLQRRAPVAQYAAIAADIIVVAAAVTAVLS